MEIPVTFRVLSRAVSGYIKRVFSIDPARVRINVPPMISGKRYKTKKGNIFYFDSFAKIMTLSTRAMGAKKKKKREIIISKNVDCVRYVRIDENEGPRKTIDCNFSSQLPH